MVPLSICLYNSISVRHRYQRSWRPKPASVLNISQSMVHYPGCQLPSSMETHRSLSNLCRQRGKPCYKPTNMNYFGAQSLSKKSWSRCATTVSLRWWWNQVTSQATLAIASSQYHRWEAHGLCLMVHPRRFLHQVQQELLGSIRGNY